MDHLSKQRRPHDPIPMESLPTLASSTRNQKGYWFLVSRSKLREPASRTDLVCCGFAQGVVTFNMDMVTSDHIRHYMSYAGFALIPLHSYRVEQFLGGSCRRDPVLLGPATGDCWRLIIHGGG